jgi:hypothetical protein
MLGIRRLAELAADENICMALLIDPAKYDYQKPARRHDLSGKDYSQTILAKVWRIDELWYTNSIARWAIACEV